jgi:hypothetical protein
MFSNSSSNKEKSHNLLFCGCTTWSVALTEQHAKNKVPKGTSGPNRMKVVTGEQRKWQYGEFNDLFFLLNLLGGSN